MVEIWEYFKDWTDKLHLNKCGTNMKFKKKILFCCLSSLFVLHEEVSIQKTSLGTESQLKKYRQQARKEGKK